VKKREKCAGRVEIKHQQRKVACVSVILMYLNATVSFNNQLTHLRKSMEAYLYIYYIACHTYYLFANKLLWIIMLT